MNKSLLIVLGAVALLFVGYLVLSGKKQATPTYPQDSTTQVGEETSNGNQITISLSEQNESGETGEATLVEDNGQVRVTLSIEGFPENTPQPAHIHTGVCPDVGGVKYPLSNVVNGASTTTLKVSLAQLEKDLPLGINVHKSVSESSVYTACGDLQF